MAPFNFRSEVNRKLGKTLEIATVAYPNLNQEEIIYKSYDNEFGIKTFLVVDGKERAPDEHLKPSEMSYHALIATQTFMSSEFFPKVYLFGKMALEYSVNFQMDADFDKVKNTIEMLHKLCADYLISYDRICRLTCGGLVIYGYVFGAKMTIPENVESHVPLSVLFLGMTERLI